MEAGQTIKERKTLYFWRCAKDEEIVLEALLPWRHPWGRGREKQENTLMFSKPNDPPL